MIDIRVIFFDVAAVLLTKMGLRVEPVFQDDRAFADLCDIDLCGGF